MAPRDAATSRRSSCAWPTRSANSTPPCRDARRAAGAASHLRAYWTPKMIRELADLVELGGGGLNPTAARALESLRRVKQG